MPVRTIALRALLVSITVGSVLGIIAILGGGMGDTGFKILITSFAISGASALVMGSLAAWELPAARLWSRAGAYGTVTALALVLYGMWTESDGDTFWKVAVSITVLGAAGAHGSLLAMARLAPRYQPMRGIALTNLVLLAATSCAFIWSIHDDTYFKLLAILAILDVAFTLAIGALDYVSRTNLIAGEGGEVCFCPRCGRRLWFPAGEVRCTHCKACFYIEMRPSQDLPTAVARET